MLTSVRGGNDRETAPEWDFDRVGSGPGCARITALALALLADSRRWLASQPAQFRGVPVEALAFSGAAVTPWRAPADLIPSLRMCLWIYAFDDLVENHGPEEGDRLDDLLARCAAVVRGKPDDSHWLPAVLSGLQRDLAARPSYRALSGLWVEKFDSMLASTRWEWSAAQLQRHDSAGLAEYLDHADSISIWVSVLARWITYGGKEILDNLATLVAALGEYVIASRLANDLASFARERDNPRETNVLKYGVSPDWVSREIDRHTEAVHELLIDLVTEDVRPAVELERETEYAATFYRLAEFRGWSADETGSVNCAG